MQAVRGGGNLDLGRGAIFALERGGKEPDRFTATQVGEQDVRINRAAPQPSVDRLSQRLILVGQFGEVDETLIGGQDQALLIGNQDRIGRRVRFRIVDGRVETHGTRVVAVPVFHQGTQRMDVMLVVIDIEYVEVLQAGRDVRYFGARARGEVLVTHRHQYREQAAAAVPGVDPYLVPEQDRETQRDAESEPGAFDVARRVDAVEVVEDALLVRIGYARPGIVDTDLDILTAAPAAQQDPAARGVFDRIGKEILQDAPQVRGVGFRDQRGGHPVKTHLAACLHAVFIGKRLDNIVQGDACPVRRERTGVESGDLQQVGNDQLGRIDRIVQMIEVVLEFGIGVGSFEQGARVKAGCV